MNKKRLVLSMLLVIVMTISIGASVFANDLTEFREAYQPFIEEEQRRLEESIRSSNREELMGVREENLPIDMGASTYPTCEKCFNFSVSVCAAEATLVDEGYHKGFLGIFNTDCYAYYYVSRGAEMCPYCANVLWMYDEHYCWEYHTECSKKGFYDVCPMQVSD